MAILLSESQICRLQAPFIEAHRIKARVKYDARHCFFIISNGFLNFVCGPRSLLAASAFSDCVHQMAVSAMAPRPEYNWINDFISHLLVKDMYRDGEIESLRYILFYIFHLMTQLKALIMIIMMHIVHSKSD
jgi:hypothetical protein